MKDKLIILAALSKARKNFPKLEENARNEYKDYSYAKLKDIYKALRKHLFEQGIEIVHGRTYIAHTNVTLQETWLVHKESGEFLCDSTAVVPERVGGQSFAANCTYIKKMALKNLCAIDAGEDDNDLVEDDIYRDNKEKVIKRIKECGSEDDQKKLWADIRKKFSIVSFKDIPEDTLDEIIKYLKDK